MRDLVARFPYRPEYFSVYFHPDCLHHEGGKDHPETPGRLAGIVEGCKQLPADLPLSFVIPETASLSDLTLVHERYYLAALEAACMKMQSTFMSDDNHISMDTYGAVLAAGGCAMALSKAVQKGQPGFALLRPPGHHAGRNVAEGYCFINHVALAIEKIRLTEPEAKFLVVDFDVHHGNGIDTIYHSCNRVYYHSLHGPPAHIYPNTGHEEEIGHGLGAGFSCNVSVPLGTTGDIWLHRFKETLYRFEEKIRPDYVFVSAGFDAHTEDPYGFMKVEDQHYLEACRILVEIAINHSQGRIGFFLEGGYSEKVLQRLVPQIIAQTAKQCRKSLTD